MKISNKRIDFSVKNFSIILFLISLIACAPNSKDDQSTLSKNKDNQTTLSKDKDYSNQQDISIGQKDRESKPLPKSRNSKAQEKIDPNNLDKKLLAQLVHDLINEVRGGVEVKALQSHTILWAAADAQNNYQIKNDALSHQQENSKMRTVKHRVDNFGGEFRTVGENVQFQGAQIRTFNGKSEVITDNYTDTANKIVNNWINSPGHKKNLLNPKFTYVGTAVGWNPKTNAIFATQVFGG